jgi:hypothetical protein
MTRAVLLAVVLLALLPACLAQPSDAEQIHALTRRIVAAAARDDWDSLYRHTDLDYRAVCTPEQFAAAMRARWDGVDAQRLAALEELSIAHIRASATLVVAGPSGTRRVPQRFIRDGGRWYLYEPEC